MGNLPIDSTNPADPGRRLGSARRPIWPRAAIGLCVGVACAIGIVALTSTSPTMPGAATKTMYRADPRPSVAPGHLTRSASNSSSSSTPASWVAVSDPPGNVYHVVPPLRAVATSTGAPADLISATASDSGTTLTFTARTVQMLDPFTNTNWTDDDTYIAWQLDTNGGVNPNYDVYFQVSSNGAPEGELTHELSGAPVSCNVTLSFSAITGYQASLATACLPGVTSFQWNVFTNFDTVSEATDPAGHDAFGKALPDRRDGGAVFAPTVTAARNGGLFSFGDTEFFGSPGGRVRPQPIAAKPVAS